MPAATVSLGRRVAAFAAMTAAGSIIGGYALRSWGGEFGLQWPLLATAIVTVLAGIGLSRRSLVAQIVSRAHAWLLALPLGIITIAAAARGNHFVAVDLIAALSGAALLLARPGLHSAEAQQAFAPRAFRRTLLAGATASASVGLAMGGVALLSGWRGLDIAALLGAGALALVASAIGVVRMRSWGILLGTVTSFAFLGAAAFLRTEQAVPLVLAAVPPLLLHLLPILVARSRNEPAHIRVAEDAALPAAPVRIAVDEELDLDVPVAKVAVARH